MGSRRKSCVATTLAIALSVGVLSGCSLVGDGGTIVGFLAEDAANAERLRQLIDDVTALPGVATADGAFDATAESPGPSVTVQADSSATAAELAAVVDRVGAEYTTEWSLYVVSAVIETAPGSRLTVTDFTRSVSDVAAQIEYWQAVEKVVGSPLQLALDLPTTHFPGGLITAPPSDLRAAPALLSHYDAFLALNPPPTGPGPLFLPGFSTSGPRPPARYVEVARRLAGIVTEPATQGVPGSGFQWSSRDDSAPGAIYYLAVAGIEYSADGTGTAAWDQVAAAAAIFSDAGLDRATFTFLRGEDPISFHVGDCADEAAPGTVPDTASDDLLPALEAAGVSLPAGAAPGYCQLWNAS